MSRAKASLQTDALLKRELFLAANQWRAQSVTSILQGVCFVSF